MDYGRKKYVGKKGGWRRAKVANIAKVATSATFFRGGQVFEGWA